VIYSKTKEKFGDLPVPHKKRLFTTEKSVIYRKKSAIRQKEIGDLPHEKSVMSCSGAGYQ
jgi:hypothetical protein